MMPEIRAFLDLSTCHAPSAAALDEIEKFATCTGEFGCFISTTEETGGEQPEWLLKVTAYARANGAAYVLFDADAPADENLERWEW